MTNNPLYFFNVAPLALLVYSKDLFQLISCDKKKHHDIIFLLY